MYACVSTRFVCSSKELKRTKVQIKVKMDTINGHPRYSRSDLLALRYEGNARLRPSCYNRAELQMLNFWKTIGPQSTSINSNSQANKSGLSPERDIPNLGSTNGLLSSRRALRNRERAHNYQRFTAGDQMGSDEIVQGSLTSNTVNLSGVYKSPNIDHRSISSAHLMPAFAKRRFIVANTVVSGGESSRGNEPSESPNEDGAKEKNPATSAQTNDDSKMNIHVTRNPLGQGSSDWERGETHSNEVDSDQATLSLSPTFLAGRQIGTLNVQERRIGSGRLLPRNDWEYKNKDADTMLNKIEKERPHNDSLSNQQQHQQRQRASSAKYERSNDICRERDRERERERERDRDRDRRLNERKPTDTRDCDAKKNVQNGRRTTNKDKFHYGESTMQNRSKRLNIYQTHERHEPEWFSAGPTSQHETIDLHGFDDFGSESSSPNEADDQKDSEATQTVEIKPNQIESKTSKSSSLLSLNTNEAISNKKDNDLNAPCVNPVPKSEEEFNFDAYLNIDPMDHTLMGTDSEVPGDVHGTSRFSQWFATKEPMKDTSTPDPQEIPSVKDLEAQMRKVDLRTENDSKHGQQRIQTEQRDKDVTRDTEGFKRLLQQLGSQNSSSSSIDWYPAIPNMAVSPARCEQDKQITPPQSHCQINEDDVQLYYLHRPKKNIDPLTNRHVEMMSQNQLQTAFVSGAHDLSMSLQVHKRMEIQQLLQGLARGDVSVDILEKELTKSNTAPQSREIIATVLFEYSNPGRPHLSRHNELNSQSLLKNNQIFNKNMMSDDFYSKNNSNQGLQHHHQHHQHQLQQQHQQQQQQQQQQHHNHHQHHQQQQQHRHTNSPTPLAFTPTSVLRKMTADKDSATSTLNNNAIFNQQYQQQYKLSVPLPKQVIAPHAMLNETTNQLQPRMILGGNYHHQLNASNSPQISPKLLPQLTQSRGQANKWPIVSNMQPSGHSVKSFGRPILKGTINSNSQHMPVGFLMNNELQQQLHQQKLKSMQTPDTIINDNMHVANNEGLSQIQHQQYMQQQRSQAQTGHRLDRLLHTDLHRQPNLPKQSVTITGVNEGGEASANLTKTNNLGAINYHRDERLSPTTNQLAQWFSPELLAQASAGKLPLLNMNQALSLEEFERSMQHSSATVLN